MGAKSGLYRTVYTTFWTDRKVQEEMTPQERYTMMYLLTSPYSQLSGCFEVSKKKIAVELGYDNSNDIIGQIFKKLVELRVIDYDQRTSEVLICNYPKHNWCASDTYMKAVKESICSVKSTKFRTYLTFLVKNQYGRKKWQDIYWDYEWNFGDEDLIIPFSGLIMESDDFEADVRNSEVPASLFEEKPKKKRSARADETAKMFSYVKDMNHSDDAKSYMNRWLQEVCLPATRMKYNTFVEVVEQLEDSVSSEDEFVESIKYSLMGGYRTFYPKKKYNNTRQFSNQYGITNDQASSSEDLGRTVSTGV